MATSVEDCEAIVNLSAESGMKYMMTETVVYAREFLYMKELYDNGDLGKLQFLKASHQWIWTDTRLLPGPAHAPCHPSQARSWTGPA